MRELTTGERMDIPPGSHEVRLAEGERPLGAAVGLLVVAVTDRGELVPGFPPVGHDQCEARPGLTWHERSRLALDLSAVPMAVEKLIFVLYLTDSAGYGDTLARGGTLSMKVGEAATFRLEMGGRDDTATIMMEVYRRHSGWRVAANGQGFAFGISAVGRALKLQLPVKDAYTGARAEAPSGPHEDEDNRRSPRASASSGSAFAISPRLLLTNHHVIEDAQSVTAAGAAGTSTCELMLADPVNDLALLRIQHDALAVACFRPDMDVDLGEDIIVAGFPLQGLLGSGPQVSAGNVSALTGIANNSGILQFTAPIGSGSSGGPILDCSGLVVGLVMAVLRHDIRDAPIAQNINFGVKAALVRSFLHAAGVAPTFGDSRSTRSRSEVARDARGYLYLINVRH